MHHCACMWRQWVWVVREGEVILFKNNYSKTVSAFLSCSSVKPNNTTLNQTWTFGSVQYVHLYVCTYVCVYPCSSYTAWVSGCYSTSSVKSTHFLVCTQHTWSGVPSFPVHAWPLDQTHTLWLYMSLEALQVGVMCVTPALTVLTLSVLCRILMRCPR